MSLTKTAQEWARILTAMGTQPATAQAWGPVFADTIKPDTFSKGEAELPDFLATVAHESGRFQSLRESGKYSAARIIQIGNSQPPGSRWRAMVPKAYELAYNEPAFFEAVYGGRLGNDQPGDGAKFPGRGLIMLTGKANYVWQGNRSGQDLVLLPQLAEGRYFALQFALDYWEGKVPDSVIGDARAIRKIINGGLIGMDDVATLKAKAVKALA